MKHSCWKRTVVDDSGGLFVLERDKRTWPNVLSPCYLVYNHEPWFEFLHQVISVYLLIWSWEVNVLCLEIHPSFCLKSFCLPVPFTLERALSHTSSNAWVSPYHYQSNDPISSQQIIPYKPSSGEWGDLSPIPFVKTQVKKKSLFFPVPFHSKSLKQLKKAFAFWLHSRVIEIAGKS